MAPNNPQAPTPRLQQAIAASFAATSAASAELVPVFFDRDGSAAGGLDAVFNGTRVRWPAGTRRSNPIPTAPGVYICIWRASGAPGDTFRLQAGPQPKVRGGFPMKTLVGSNNESTFRVLVTP